MKINKKIIIIVCVVIAAVTVLCSCRVNTSSTNTEYKYVMIGPLSDADEQTVNGAVWRAIKAYQKNSPDEKTNDKHTAIKYYTPAEVTATDSKSYTEAFTEAAKKQLDLAAERSASIVILPSDAYSDAYLSVKDNKNFKNTNFIIITVPGSSTSNVIALNSKTTAVVIDTLQYGYVFGYVLTLKGYASIGYIGAEGKTSECFTEGVKAGCKDAAAAKGSADPTVVTKIITVGPNASVIEENADALAAECEVVIGDEMTQAAAAKAAVSANKKYASIFEDDNAVMTYSLDCDVFTEKLTNYISECGKYSNGYVVPSYLGRSDGIFTLKSDISDSEEEALWASVSAFSAKTEE